jgi:hypothetical protein
MQAAWLAANVSKLLRYGCGGVAPCCKLGGAGTSGCVDGFSNALYKALINKAPEDHTRNTPAAGAITLLAKGEMAPNNTEAPRHSLGDIGEVFMSNYTHIFVTYILNDV